MFFPNNGWHTIYTAMVNSSSDAVNEWAGNLSEATIEQKTS